MFRTITAASPILSDVFYTTSEGKTNWDYVDCFKEACMLLISDPIIIWIIHMVRVHIHYCQMFVAT